MRTITKWTLRCFWGLHPAAEIPLRTWHHIVGKAQWSGPADIKRQFGSAVDFVRDNRVIFDIGGNKYRLIAHIAYPYGRVLIKFVGTHRDCDKIDPERV